MSIKKILEKNGFTVKKEGNWWSISQYTPAGEDWYLSFECLSDFKRYAEDYDPEDDFKMWVNARGKVSGVPDIPELWQDQLWKQETLKKCLDEIK